MKNVASLLRRPTQGPTTTRMRLYVGLPGVRGMSADLKTDLCSCLVEAGFTDVEIVDGGRSDVVVEFDTRHKVPPVTAGQPQGKTGVAIDEAMYAWDALIPFNHALSMTWRRVDEPSKTAHLPGWPKLAH